MVSGLISDVRPQNREFAGSEITVQSFLQELTDSTMGAFIFGISCWGFIILYSNYIENTLGNVSSLCVKQTPISPKPQPTAYTTRYPKSDIAEPNSRT